MTPAPAYRASVLIAAALLLFSACAGTGDLAPVGDDEFKTRVAEVFVAGFGGVADKYIEPVAVHSIAIDGMRGLGSIDPALTVARDEGRVVLFASGHEVARLPAPNDGDVVGWANLAADVSLAARGASSDLRSANVEALYEAVFDGVLSRLDIFSRYAGAVEARKNRAKREGFGGIGIRYQIEDGVPVINDVLAGTPAATAGLRKGDRIVAVDGAVLKGLARNEVSDKLRGPIHSKVELTIDRPGEVQPMVIGMERGHIFGVTVTASHKDGIL
ncbi:MAG: PDZ domain-containing protein, partial [Rhodospirillales bacterium]|nr:PDZ domain-containing protein [Rhodospirillales bacterium]